MGVRPPGPAAGARARLLRCRTRHARQRRRPRAGGRHARVPGAGQSGRGVYRAEV
jgi:hypothetical protein